MIGSQPADLCSGDGEIGAQAGGGYWWLSALEGSRGGCGAVVGLALPGGVEVFSDSVGVDEPGGHARCGGDSGGRDRRPRCPGPSLRCFDLRLCRGCAPALLPVVHVSFAV